MMRFPMLVAVVALLAACGGSDNDSTGPGSSSGTGLTGTFIGSYTATVDPGVVYQGVLQLTQSGSNVTGSLTTNAGRSASVAGSVSGSRLTATFTFTDGCNGSAQSTADISGSGTVLTGNYTANDCVGQYSGGYSLSKQ